MSLNKENALDILQKRGFVAQCTDLDGLRDRLAAGPTTFYIGFDGTADSLHVGHLVSLMSMRWISACGHKPIALVGGATSMVGDPSFRNAARPVLDKQAVQHNIVSITANIRQVVDNSDLVVANNADWLGNVGFIDFMREVGSHFTIARMLSMDTVKSRLEAQESMTALEFCYMMLQSHDFQHLARQFDCSLQMGGSDQWGNIVNGIDLTRKADGKNLFGLTTPLLSNADGTKMGKTANGAVWLSPDKTPPFEFWQFWRNVDDRDVERFLNLFTLIEVKEIDALCATKSANAINNAKIRLANAVTTLVHGEVAALAAEKQAQALFAGTGRAEKVALCLSGDTTVQDVLLALGWVKSKGEARRLVADKGVRIDGSTVTDERGSLSDSQEFLIEKGKKQKAIVSLVK